MNRVAGLAGGGIVVALLAGSVGLYVGRGSIAESAARKWLTDHGVAASAIEIEGLSPNGFTARLRLGEAGDPDLTVEHMDVRYDLTGPWSGSDLAINPRSVRLVGLRLKARLSHGVVSLGAVDKVIKAIEQLPPSKAPPPAVFLQDGEVRLVSDGGVVRLHGAGSFNPGAASTLQGQLAPFHLAFDGHRFDGAGGIVSVASKGGRLKGHVDLGQAAYAEPGVSMRATHAGLSAEAPMPGGPGAWGGLVTANLDAEGLAATRPGEAVDGAAFTAQFAGVANIAVDRRSLRGDLRIGGHATSLRGPKVAMQNAATEATVSGISLVNDRLGTVARATVQAKMTVGSLATPTARLTEVSSAMHADRIDFHGAGAGAVVSGVILGDLAARGDINGPAGDAPYAEALRRALHDFRLSGAHWQADITSQSGGVRLVSPLVFVATSGARAELTGDGRVMASTPLTATGAASLTVAGGGLPSIKAEIVNANLARGALTADVSTQGALDLPPAEGARFAINGRMSLNGQGGRLDLANCAPVTITRINIDPNPATGIAVRICPADSPLIVGDAHGWRVQGRFDGLTGDMSGADASLRGAAGSFVANGTQAGLSGANALVDRFQVVDSSAPQRFKPIAGAGHLDVAMGVATGSFKFGPSQNSALATISLRHDLASGVGRADIEARNVAFAPGALQPTDISGLATVARNARGPLSFTGWLAWTPKADLKSGGEAIARGFGFDSPLGPVVGLDADIHFVSLAPLVTAPEQTLSLQQVRAVLPLSLLAAKFGLGAERLTLTTASGAMANGRIRLEPMKIQLAPDASFEGAIVFDHVNLGDILSATNLSDTVQTNAVVDGRIPFAVGPHGVTISQGHLAAIGPGRVSISRKALSGVATGTADQPGFAQDLAYQAMENLAFDQMDASINSQAHDRLGMLFHIKGRHDPPTRQKATLAVKDVLSGHAMDKPMMLPSDTKIDLTLDTSLNFGDLVEALGQAWRDALSSNREAGRSGQVQRTDVKGVRP